MLAEQERLAPSCNRRRRSVLRPVTGVRRRGYAPPSKTIIRIRDNSLPLLPRHVCPLLSRRKVKTKPTAGDAWARYGESTSFVSFPLPCHDFMMTMFKSLRSIFKKLKKKCKAGCSNLAAPDIECPSTEFTKPSSTAGSSSQTRIIRTFERPRPLTSKHFHVSANANNADANKPSNVPAEAAYTFAASRMIAVQNGPHVAPAILPTQDFVRHLQESLQAKRTYFYLLERHECANKKDCKLLWDTWERYCRLRDGVDIRLEEVWIGCGLLDRQHRPEPYIFEEDLWEESDDSKGKCSKGCGYGRNKAGGAPVLPELSFLKDERQHEEQMGKLPFNPIFPASGGVFDGSIGRDASRLIVRRAGGSETKIPGSTKQCRKQERRLPKPSQRKRRVHWDERNLGECSNWALENGQLTGSKFAARVAMC